MSSSPAKIKPPPPPPLNVDNVLGKHPIAPHVFGEYLVSRDELTDKKVPHRALSERTAYRATAVVRLRELVTVHHADEAALSRIKLLRERAVKEGHAVGLDSLRSFPASSTTRRGNLAEIVLAEYISAASGATLPIYRLRYNPNVDQSMKGDDVLAFDLDAKPVRIIVGESKFRGKSAPVAVREIVEGLLRSHAVNLPISLPFVANRLFEQGQDELGEKVLNCSLLFAEGRLRVDYVGLLLSDARAPAHVKEHAESTVRRLAIVSLVADNAEQFVEDCYAGLV